MYVILAEIVKKGLNYGSVESEDFLLIKEVLQLAKDGIMDTSKLVLAVTKNKDLFTMNSV